MEEPDEGTEAGSEQAGTWPWRLRSVGAVPSKFCKRTCFPAVGAAVTLQPFLAKLLPLPSHALLPAPQPQS